MRLDLKRSGKSSVLAWQETASGKGPRFSDVATENPGYAFIRHIPILSSQKLEVSTPRFCPHKQLPPTPISRTDLPLQFTLGGPCHILQSASLDHKTRALNVISMKTSLRTRQCRNGLASLSTPGGQVLGPHMRLISTPVVHEPKTRNRYASTAANGLVSREGRFSPLPDHVKHAIPEIRQLLSAVQTKHTARAIEALLKLGELIDEDKKNGNRRMKSSLAWLPSTTFSEILRSFDPLTTSDHDVLHGLHLGPNFSSHSPSAAAIDDNGVRQVRKQIFEALFKMFDLQRRRGTSDPGVTIPDYEIMMRCAAAAFELQHVKFLFGATAVDGLASERTLRTWTDFLQGRFLTEPSYYQFDRSRVALLPQDRKNSGAMVGKEMLESLERMRMHLNITKKSPWNRDEDIDIRRRLRRRHGRKSMNEHFLRGLYYGHGMDEETLCCVMIGMARSGSVRLICQAIFKQFYGIDITIPTDPLQISISGGSDFPPDSPSKPTARLLDAVVEAFGSMSHIPAALRLIDFISRRWQIPIPAETWSNLLQWTHVHSSRPFRPMQRVAGAYPNNYVKNHHVKLVFDIMISEPYRVIPTIEDYNVIVKNLIHTKSFRAATDIMRNQILSYYHTLVHQHEQAVLDEILQENIYDNKTPCPGAAFKRLATSAKKDYVYNMINRWCRTIITRVQPSNANMAQTTLPKLLEEFSDFFPPVLSYRLPGGLVQINIKEGSLKRHTVVPSERWTLPAKRAWSPGRVTSEKAAPWGWEEELVIKGHQKVPSLRAKQLTHSEGETSGEEKSGEIIPSWTAVQRELQL